MKKYIITAVVAALQIVAVAQTVNVHFKNGQAIQYPSSNVDYVDFSEKASAPIVSAGAVVDLGLSVFWCSCNVGAEAPEEEGNRYSWGETKTKNSYSKDNYSYYDSNTWKYIEIGNQISGTEYDAATANLGSDWKIPTKNQMQELINKCTWEWTQINSVNGYKITGPNGNSIFIASGPNSVLGKRYWTGDDAQILYVTPDRAYIASQKEYRYEGCYIRPVTSNPNAEGGPVDHNQDYLVTDKVTVSFTGGAYSQINNRIQAGSVLNTKFTNGSSEAVTLVSVQIFESGSSNAGNNALESEVEVAAGESKAYGLRLGTSMTTPVVRFTYRYNKKNYTAEATWNF